MPRHTQCALALTTCFGLVFGTTQFDLAQAQEAIKWEQVQNIEKGRGAPSGVTLDILGVEIGDSYASAKGKLDRIVAELKEGETGKLRQEESYFRLPTGAGSFVETKFVSKAILDIDGRSPNTNQMIAVYFSAPSSGAQVIGIERLISYYDQASQIRIGDLLPQVTKKYGQEPFVTGKHSTSTHYRYQINDGQPFKSANVLDCAGGYWLSLGKTERDLERINHSGECDILLDVQFNHGISNEHAKAVWFKLIDADRAKSNHQADYQYFRDYIARLRQTTGGQVPKL